MVVIVWSRLSASPLAVAWMMLNTSSSNCNHSLRLLAGGHLIRCWTTLLGFGGSGTWRDWALWVASWPGSSCVSPGSRPVRCTSLSRSKHFILAWWIFRPRWFLHSFPQMHVTFVVCPFAWVVNLWSVRLEISSSPPLGISWGYLSIGLSVACLGSLSRKIQAGVLTHTVPGAVFPCRQLSLQ